MAGVMMKRFIFAGHAPAMLLCASAMLSPAHAAAPAPAAQPPAASSAPAACKGTIYMTFDTGSQSQAQLIADVLNRRHVKATFFLANE